VLLEYQNSFFSFLSIKHVVGYNSVHAGGGN
jgi:hypothetical protein